MTEDENEKLKTWGWGEENYYNIFVKDRYKDRQALAEQVAEKKKALEKHKPGEPLHQRAALILEMAEMRYDMAFMVAMNERMRGHIETLDYVHQQISIMSGAYAHTKMLAEDARINYARIHKGLKTIQSLTEELTNDINTTNKRTDGAENKLHPNEAG